MLYWCWIVATCSASAPAAMASWRGWWGPSWEYRLLHQDGGERIQRLPLALDSLATPGLIFYCHEQSPGVSSVLFLDPDNGHPLPPFFHDPDSTLHFGPPLAVQGSYSWPLVALVAESRLRPPRLRVYLPVDSLDNPESHPYREMLLELPPPGTEALSKAAMPLEQRAWLLDLGDLAPERPGLEALVQGWWPCRDFGASRSGLNLVGIEDGALLWQLSLPTTVSALVRRTGEVGGWLGVLRATGNGRSASGLDDNQGWLFQVERHGCLGLTEAVAGSGQAGVELGLVGLPGGKEVLLLVGARPGPVATARLEVRRAKDLSTVATQAGTGAEEGFSFPVAGGREEGAWRALLLTQDHGLLLVDECLRQVASHDPGEACRLLGWAPLTEDGTKPGLAVGTAGGRLLLFDETLELMADQQVWPEAIQPRLQRTLGMALSRYRHGGGLTWVLNTSRGSLDGHWVRTTALTRSVILAGILLLLAVLLWSLGRVTLRWRQQRAAIRTLFGQSPDGILLVDRKRRLVDCNTRCAALLGLPPAPAGRPKQLARTLWKWLGAPAAWRPRLDDLVRDRPLEILWAQLAEDDPRQGRCSLLVDGQPMDILYRFQPVRGQWLRYGWALTLMDITRQLDAHRRDVWRSLARNAAHRVNTPLQAIFLRTDNLVHRLLGNGAETAVSVSGREVRERVAEIEASAREIQLVINDHLAVSDLHLRLERLAPGEVLRHHVRRYRESFGGAEISLELEVEEGLPFILGDSFHLVSLLLNMLDNARRALEGKGTITVRVRRALEEGWVELEVEDDGTGIAPDHLSRLFTPHATFAAGGHGLGLTIARDIAEAHGGRIHVQSAAGVGTLFRVTLPCLEET